MRHPGDLLEKLVQVSRLKDLVRFQLGSEGKNGLVGSVKGEVMVKSFPKITQVKIAEGPVANTAFWGCKRHQVLPPKVPTSRCMILPTIPLGNQ